MLRPVLTSFSKQQSRIALVTFLGAALGCVCLMHFGSRDTVAVKVLSDWSLQVVGSMATLFTIVFAVGLLKPQSLQSTVTIPLTIQRGIYFAGLAAMSSVMLISAISMSVWADYKQKHLPNRFFAMTSVMTQKMLFGDYAALHLVWTMYENAKDCGDSSDANYYRDQAEMLCLSTPTLHYKREKRANGDLIHEYRNSTMGSLNGSGFVYQDESSANFSDEGWVTFDKGFSEIYPINIGEPIRTINVTERTDGTKIHRFNESNQPQLTIYPRGRGIVAHLANGDTLTDIAVSNRDTIKSKDNLEITFKNYCNTMQIPMEVRQIAGGTSLTPMHEIQIAGPMMGLYHPLDSRLSRVRLLEHQSGLKDLTFWYESGLAERTIQLPPTPTIKELMAPHPGSSMNPAMQHWFDAIRPQLTALRSMEVQGVTVD